jgi:YVTN family beta-propeller protein
MLPGRFRGVRLITVLCGVLAAALIAAAPAVARKAYVTNSGSGTVSVIDTVTDSQIGSIPVGAEPVDVAITPDGGRAYVVNQGSGTVSVIDTAGDTVIGAIAVGSEPHGIAITPDGSRAYVSNWGDGTVSVINTATNALSRGPITVGAEPDGVAVSPDGTRVAVAQGSGDVSLISTGSGAVVDTVTDPLGPSRISMGPRGGRAFVTNKMDSVTAFNPANGAVIGVPIAVGQEPAGIAVTPSGLDAYVTSPVDGTLMEIDASLDSVVGAPISGFPGATGIGFEPSGLSALVTNGSGDGLNLLDAVHNVPVGGIASGSRPVAVAVVPDQAPRAFFWVSPVPQTLRRAKRRLTFHGSNSLDSDGRIVNYAWDFGDGGHIEGESPTRVHKYRRPGTYLVTLTVSDEEGCSTVPVFTGQTTSCTGSSAATMSIPVTVLETTGPVVRLAGPKKQRLRGRVILRARCPRVACAIRATGRLKTAIEGARGVRHGSRRIGGASATLAPGVWHRLSLRVPGGSRRAARRILLSGGEAAVRVSVVATDATGSQYEDTRKIDLVLR